ncbi:hypothetical protein [Luteimicrobium subarcticum]|uniref:Uncharacterized protein n=1 Tax=Luteimicrobium subarcticum TaxID=620910 RepID=A0A2M8W6Z5_9MICO|nr:hypothetical protein [Luteimicrobium subarcticum]PJI86707.1 hypothetical protein CLV34_2627 [Luteimicrobium subarcticum]
MTTTDDVRRADQADAILDVVAAVEAVREGRDGDLCFVVAGRSDDTFHDLLVATVARALGGSRERLLPEGLEVLSPHTWTELHARVPALVEHHHAPRHASPDEVPVADRNVELVRAFAALLEADDLACGEGHSAQVLATARRMALRVAA